MRILRWLTAIIVVAAGAGAVLGQANVKQNISGKVGGMVEGHNQELENAMNGDEPKQPPVTATQAAANAVAPTDGWIERKLVGGVTVRLYFAHPPISAGAKPKMPGILVMQEWWGLNDDIQERTRELAGKGYYAVAVDLYDGKVTKDPKEAPTLKAKVTDAAALVRMKTGVSLLADEARSGVVDANRIGVIGWCMGGEQALKLAVADPRIKALVMFYGTPVTDAEQLKNIKGPMLGIFGKEDKSISNEQVDQLEKGLTDAKVAHEIHRYDGVGHAFASKAAKEMGMYNEEKAAEAWKVTWAWLDKNLTGAK